MMKKLLTLFLAASAILPLAAGNLVAGTLITLLTLAFKEHVNLILNIVLILAAIMLVVTIVKIALTKPETAQTDAPAEKEVDDGDGKN